MTPRRNFVLVGVAGLALALALFATSVYFSTDNTAGLSTPGDSRYYVTKPEVYQFGNNGQLLYILSAERSLYLQSGAIRMRQPRMRHYGDTPGYWWIAASQGYVPPGRERVRLSQNVRAISHNTDQGETTVRTSRAYVHPQQNLVTSRRYVVAEMPTRRLTGTGMRLDLKTNHIEILNDAEVTYYR